MLRVLTTIIAFRAKHGPGVDPGAPLVRAKQSPSKEESAELRMTVLYLKALLAIALALSILMACAWGVQQRTGNSGWVDTIWTFSVGFVGVGSALLPLGAPPTVRQWLV